MWTLVAVELGKSNYGSFNTKMKINLTIKLWNGDGFVFGDVDLSRLRLSGESIAIYPQDGLAVRADIFELTSVKEITIKPMPDMHAKILAWERSLPALPPQPIGLP